MKRNLIISFFIIICISLNANDIIYLMDHNKIEAEIISLKMDSIYYRPEANGRVFALQNEKIDFIIFNNGKIVRLNSSEQPSADSNSQVPPTNKNNAKKKKEKSWGSIKITYQDVDVTQLTYIQDLSAWGQLGGLAGMAAGAPKLLEMAENQMRKKAEKIGAKVVLITTTSYDFITGCSLTGAAYK